VLALDRRLALLLRALSVALALLLVVAGALPRVALAAGQLSAESAAWRLALDKRQPVADRVDVRSELRGRTPDCGPADLPPFAALVSVEPARLGSHVASDLLAVECDLLAEAFPQRSGPSARAPPRC